MTIDQALTDIMQLDYNSGEMLLEILKKRQIEAAGMKLPKMKNRQQ